MKFVDYFLVVQDFISFAKGQGIAVGPGRGSAAGSIVSYLLNITGIDPLAFNLYFERFLNPERISMPDIDIDFEDARRGEVIKYVREKYGSDKVAQVATFGKMESRAAIRDVARAYKYKMEEVNQIAKSIPLGFHLDQAYSDSPEFKKIIDSSDRNMNLYKTALQIEGITRNFSVHAAGVVIGDEPLWNYVPLTCDKEGNVVTQYDKDIVEKMGLLKFDFLGLRNLSTISDSVKLIKELYNVDINIDKLPPNDPAVYAMYQKGNSKGVFQVESRGMRQIMKELKPNSLEDIIALIALYRPGPMLLIKDFIRNKFHPEEIVYDHPDLKPILENTYGICVYQEQVMRIAQVMGGFTLGQADILRKAMGKKKKELMEEQKKIFISNSVERGYPKEIAVKVFTNLEYFAGYGFNRAHAAAYGVISYQTAYLKANYPIPYMASLLNSIKDDEKKLAEYIEEARALGITVLGPSINKSKEDFSVEDGNIRYGLLAIKNVGKAALDLLIADRTEKGDYKNFTNFTYRSGSGKINRKVIEHLIKAGAFDELKEDRCDLLKKLDGNDTQSFSLFDMLDPSLNGGDNQPAKKEIDPEMLMNFEKEALGFYLTYHPFSPYKNAFTDIDCLDMAEIPDISDEETRIVVFGRIDGIRIPKKKNAKPSESANGKSQSVIVTASDLTGTVEFLAYGKAMDTLLEKKDLPGAFVLDLRVRNEEDRQRISLQEVKKFITREQMQRELSNSVQFTLYIDLNKVGTEVLTQLITLLRAYPGGNPVRLFLMKGNLEIHSEAGFKFRVSRSQELIEKLGTLLGKDNVGIRKC
jgi:DNA polymerase-3 subunit alpha